MCANLSVHSQAETQYNAELLGGHFSLTWHCACHQNIFSDLPNMYPFLQLQIEPEKLRNKRDIITTLYCH